MSDWNSGYVSDIEYTAGFYRELAPNFLNLACLMHGYDAPDIEGRFTYCELGCGQGLSTMMLAAAYPHGEFYAFDFNPTHIASAEKLARDAGLENIRFFDSSFMELANDTQNQHALPALDYIVFHGIYSWINEENRNYLQEICKSRLRAGGVVYNSYNAMPGWATHAPLQYLLRELANTQAGPSDQRMLNARQTLDEFAKTEPRLFQAIPSLASHLTRLATQPPNYLVHEYLHDSWKAFFASEVIADMSSAKLSYIGQANPIDAYPQLTLPEQSRGFIDKLPTEALKQDFKDSALNNQFRKDIYIRGPVKLVGEQQRKKLAELNVQLTAERSAISLKFATPVGEVSGKPEAYNPLIDAIAGKTITLKELAETLNMSLIEAVQSCMLLINHSVLHPTVAPSAHALSASSRLNAVLAQRAEDQNSHYYLAAPTIGSAIPVAHIDRLLLNGYVIEQHQDIKALEEHVLNCIQARHLTINKEGKALSNVEEIRAEISQRVISWTGTILPLWQQLGVIPK